VTAALREFRFADFSEREGEIFRVAAGDGEVEMELDLALAVPGSRREGGGFKLEFLGPAQPLLQQATYAFEKAGERFEIFIVPIAREGDRLRYEAIFY
jgi:hypothetical protein